MVLCPLHDDSAPSLAIRYDPGQGRTLVHCHAGCDTQDVLAKLGLGWEALFDEPLAADGKGEKLCEYVYQRPDGSPYFVSERWRAPGGKKTFRQRLAESERYGLGRDFRPCLYKLPEVLAAARDGEAVWISEGEKDVAALRTLGATATTAPSGTSGWRDYFPSWLAGCSRVMVVCDDDEAGHKYAGMIAGAIRGAGIPVSTVKPKTGKDAFEHIAAGFGLADFVPVTLNRLRPRGVTANELLLKEFPEIRWAIPGLLAPGLTLLGGTAKIGKSYVTLDMALAVALGGIALSGLPCEQGSVLYLSLDNDSERRIQNRVRYLLHTSDLDKDIPIEFHTEWPVGTEAIAACQDWLNENTDALLVVVDTLVKVEPGFDQGDMNGGSLYSKSTELLSRWAKFANDNNVALVCVHHDKKSAADDWVNRFTGSRGISATAQTLMLIDAARNAKEGMLRISGRDLETDDLTLRKVGKSWVLADLPSSLINYSGPTRDVVEYILDNARIARDTSMLEIKEMFGDQMTDNRITTILSRAVEKNLIRRLQRGLYAGPLDETPPT